MNLHLSNGHVAKIDAADFDVVASYTWRGLVTRRADLVYAVTSLPRPKDGGPRQVLRMHRLIMGLGPGRMPEVDHIDHDGLNNQRANLRLATGSQNGGNRRPQTGVKYKGVSWNNRDQRWQAHIYREGKQRSLGYFTDQLEAALAYDAAAREIWGEFAQVNVDGARISST